MPASVVKTKREEELWERAKEVAAEAGEGENWAYIMGIFKKMNPDRFKEAGLTMPSMDGRLTSDADRSAIFDYKNPLYPGTGSQMPFPRDRNGDFVQPKQYGMMKIPGYEWHDKSPAFHSSYTGDDGVIPRVKMAKMDKAAARVADRYLARLKS